MSTVLKSAAIEFSTFDAATELAAQRELYRDCFPEMIGTDSESLAHYHWKFHQFPASPPSYEYKATTADGRMVGYYAALPYPYIIDGRPMTCAMVCDVMTHSSMRGQGIFTKLGRQSTEGLRASGLSFASGYPVRAEVIPGHLKVGWNIAFQLPMYMQILKTNAGLKGKKIHALSPIFNFACKIWRTTQKLVTPAPSGYQVSCQSLEQFFTSAEYESFYRSWSSNYKNHLVKDRSFLKWRLSAPGSVYKIVTAHKAGQLAGLAIVRVVPLKDVPSLAILDLMLLDEHEAAIPALIYALTDLAIEQRAEVIVSMMSRTCAKKYRLGRFGFLKSPFTFNLILKDLSTTTPMQNVTKEDDWHLMWIDSDDL